jgi:tetratricopeptide (TPR) repeat protein
MRHRRLRNALVLALGLVILAACRSANRVSVITATPHGKTTPTAEVGSLPTPLQAASLPSPDPAGSPAQTTTAGPTPTLGPVACGDLDRVWGDWPLTIDVLNKLIDTEQSCGPEPLNSKLYAAHFNYAAALETQGDTEQAIAHYRDALRLDLHRADALKALARLGGLPSPTPSPCDPVDLGLAVPSVPSTADPAQFAKVSGDRLTLAGQPYRIKGVNYYPRHAPWERFLAQADLAEVATELDMIHTAGFNTLRIFLWHDPLFSCTGGQTVPDAALFKKIDQILVLAAQRNLRVIVTLNDLPDLYIAPLYTATAYDDAETAYIVRRYQASPAILAWDLRNEGDLDYITRGAVLPRFTQEQVLGWLGHISEIVRTNDPNHLITAGWWGDPTVTDPYVDFLSFHHWGKADLMQPRIDEYRKHSSKPLLLQEFGYAYRGTDDSTGQAVLLGDVARLADADNLVGWVVWTAFDFQPAPGREANYETFFGLWTLDLVPKAALAQLPLH